MTKSDSQRTDDDSNNSDDWSGTKALEVWIKMARSSEPYRSPSLSSMQLTLKQAEEIKSELAAAKEELKLMGLTVEEFQSDNEQAEQRLAEAVKGLKIYDECMQELSFYVGHTYGRVTKSAHAQAVATCDKGMKAQAILDAAIAEGKK
mgnify:CR=1 FL=1